MKMTIDIPINAGEGGAINSDHVNRHIQSTNHTIVAIGEAVLDVRRSRVNQHTRWVPASRLDATGLVDHAQLLHLVVADVDQELAEQSNVLVILGPRCILDGVTGQCVQLANQLCNSSNHEIKSI
jgi:hypothetical protein